MEGRKGETSEGESNFERHGGRTEKVDAKLTDQLSTCGKGEGEAQREGGRRL